MNPKNLSNFTSWPQTTKAWWVMGLSLGAFFVVPVLGLLSANLRRLLDPVSMNAGNQSIMGGGGFAAMVFSLGFAIAALVTGIQAVRAGERSWVVWASLLLALLVAGFWIFMIVGEIAFPH